MGFYAPAQIVRDAREHGVELRAADVNHSHWDCTLEPSLSGRGAFLEPSPSGRGQGEGVCHRSDGADMVSPVDPHPNPLPEGEGTVRGTGEGAAGGRGGAKFRALRLGFRQIKGFAENDAAALVAARGAFYAAPRDLWRRAGLGAGALERLAQADAFRSLGLDRRQALWAVKGLGGPDLPLFAAAASRTRSETASPETALPAMTLGQHVAEDYAALRLSLKEHPVAFLRAALAREGMVRAADLAHLPVGRRLAIAGLVLVRQRPGTASGVIFATIEDETGVANLILWPPVFEAYRREALGASLLGCVGRLQREGIVTHIVAERLRDLSPRLRELRRSSAPPLDQAAAGETPPRRLPEAADLVVSSRDFR
jgi:error-prone DNA polymerase